MPRTPPVSGVRGIRASAGALVDFEDDHARRRLEPAAVLAPHRDRDRRDRRSGRGHRCGVCDLGEHAAHSPSGRVHAAARAPRARLRPRRGADVREPQLRQHPGPALHGGREDRRRVRRDRAGRFRQPRPRRHAGRGARLHGPDRPHHAATAARPGRDVPAREHAAVRHRASARERADAHHAGHQQRLRARLRRHLPRVAAPRTHRSRVPRRDGRVQPRDAAGVLDPRPPVRRLRPLVRRRPLADVLQPLVLPRVDLARVRREPHRRLV